MQADTDTHTHTLMHTEQKRTGKKIQKSARDTEQKRTEQHEKNGKKCC